MWRELKASSREARQRAYARYSGFKVGAALLTEDGKIFTGCNVENASYGLTICAERAAVCSAIAAGAGRVVAVCVSLTGIAVPCGTCRQFLHEFNPEMLVLLDDLSSPDTVPELTSLSALLPRPFSFL
ncbi:MAG: cytidine deaminase [Planctomyces sp.]|nr:cytidine deaminase [Planctomyces sp.]